MQPDDPVCLCFHVTRRKIVNFIRIEKPKRPSQLSQCFGAGTGCGWCRGYLERLLASELQSQSAATEPNSQSETDPTLKVASSDEPSSDPSSSNEPSFADYARQRADYVRDGGGTPPPGAIPIDDSSESGR